MLCKLLGKLRKNIFKFENILKKLENIVKILSQNRFKERRSEMLKNYVFGTKMHRKLSQKGSKIHQKSIQNRCQNRGQKKYRKTEGPDHRFGTAVGPKSSKQGNKKPSV